jgi:hypothetical protein
MERPIAFCGLVCSECPAYVATQKDDVEQRKKLAAEWSIPEYPLKPEDVHCEGCVAVNGRVMSFCTDCDVRQCGIEKGVENCALCDDYPCGKHDKIFERSPEAKQTLEEIRNEMS